MKNSLLLLLAVSAFTASGFAQSTLYMNPAATGNLTGTNVWATTLGGTYNQQWADSNNMYFDPTGTTTSYTINSNMVTGGTITLGNTSGGTQQTVRLNSSGNTVSFTNVTFLDTAATDTLSYYGPTLPGGSFSVNGRGVFQLIGSPSSTFSGTITANSGTSGASQNAQILVSSNGYSGTGTHIVLNGTNNNSQAQLSMPGGTTLTIGSLTGNANSQVSPSGGSGLTTLIVDQATDTIYASTLGGNAFGFTTNRTGLVQKQGAGTLTFSGANAFGNTNTDFAVSGGKLVVGAGTTNSGVADYNAIAVNAGGTLASDATGRVLIGSSQTVSGGLITTNGSNTNGFIATTAGTNSFIDPTGTFAITELQATNGLSLKIDSAADRLSLFTLGGATNAGGFKIDLTGFSAIADNTTYTVLSWISATNVDLTDFAGVLGGGKSMNSSFGTGGFNFSTSAGVTSLELQVVPEPATWTLLAGAGALFVLIRRRKRA